MRYLTNRISLCLLALALFASNAAQALPSYQVRVDTAGFTGQGIMDFTFLANAGATPASAVMSNFKGAFGGNADRSPNAAGGIPGGLTLSNQDGGDYLSQFVTLGGWFSFDISFNGDFATVDNLDGSQFNATLYNADFTDYIGAAGSFVEFALLPQTGATPGGIEVSAVAGLASVAEGTAVPEPSSVLLALGALALLGAGRVKRVAKS